MLAWMKACPSRLMSTPAGDVLVALVIRPVLTGLGFLAAGLAMVIYSLVVFLTVVTGREIK